MENCALYLLFLLLRFVPQSYANPYGYYYPSYSRSRRDPATATEWQQVNQLQNYGNAYGYQRQQQQYQPYNPQQMMPAQSAAEYQNSYRDAAVVPPLVPISGSSQTTDTKLYSQQQQVGYADATGVDRQGELYGMFGRNADTHNQAVPQPLPVGAYAGDLQQPTRLDNYKQGMDFSQMSNVQQPNIGYTDGLPHQANAHTGGSF